MLHYPLAEQQPAAAPAAAPTRTSRANRWTVADPLKDETANSTARAKRGPPRSTPVPFKGLRQLNKTAAARRDAGLKLRLSAARGLERGAFPVSTHFAPPGGKAGLPEKLARALAESEAIDVKEFVESFEVFTHLRHKRHRLLRGASGGAGGGEGGGGGVVVVDLCCGHGLTGLLFAVFERDVAKVVLHDRTRPPAFGKILEACVEVAPWVAPKVQELWGVELDALQADPEAHLPPGPRTLVIGVHACGYATDMCLQVALTLGAAVGLLPCCHRQHATYRKTQSTWESINSMLALELTSLP